MLTNLIVGDWSHDGHGMTKTITVEHNLDSVTALQNAFQIGTDKLGINLENECKNFEDSEVSNIFVQSLQNLGLLPENLEEQDMLWNDSDTAGTFFVEGPEAYAKLWLIVAKLGNSKLEATIVKDETASIKIGGYGLFCP